MPGGLALPRGARLRSYEQRALALPAYGELPMFNSTASNGAVLMATLGVTSPNGNFAFLEGRTVVRVQNLFLDTTCLCSGSAHGFHYCADMPCAAQFRLLSDDVVTHSTDMLKV